MATQFPDAQDAPRVVDADSVYDVDYMQSVDDQIQAIGRGIVEVRNRSNVAMFAKADSSGAISPSYGVALIASGVAEDPTIVPATAAALAAGAILCGVSIETIGMGSRGRIVTRGIVPPSQSGLSSAGPVRLNNSTGKLEVVTVGSALSVDVYVGTSRADGVLVVDLGGDAVKTGLNVIALSDANYTLTLADATKRTLYFTGTLTAARTITFPQFGGGFWNVFNATGQTLNLVTFASSIALAASSGTIVGVGQSGVLRKFGG